MKPVLMTGSAILLVLAAAGQARAECPADIDAFAREYQQAMASAGAGEALSAAEQAELIGLRTTAENLYRAGNVEMCEQAIQRAHLLLDAAIAPSALQPDELVGMDVRNDQDEKLGEVEEIAVDPVSGRIAYVLLEHGGFLGIGTHLYPVPWRAITWTPGAEFLLLNIDEERLESAPEYVEEETDSRQRREWLMAVHSYYGVEPYWQDNIGSMALGGAAAGQGAGGVPAQEGETTVAVVPAEQDQSAAGQESAAGTAAEGQAQPGQAVGESAQPATTGEGQAGTAPTVAAVPQPASGTAGTARGDGAVGALMERLDRIEAQIQKLSGQGGEEMRQALEEMRAQMQQLAESAPGEELRQGLARLQEQVQALGQSGPGQEVQAAVQRLEQQVARLAESRPGEEIRDMLARLQSEVRELAGGQREEATQPAQQFQAGQSGGIQTGQSGGTQAGQAGGTEAGQATGTQAGQADGTQASQAGGTQSGQAGGTQAGQAGGGTAAATAERANPLATESQAAGGMTEGTAVLMVPTNQGSGAGGQDGGVAAEVSDDREVTIFTVPVTRPSAAGSQGASAAQSGQTAAIGVQEAEPVSEAPAVRGGTLPTPAVQSGQTETATGGTGAQAALGDGGEAQSCEMEIAELEQDLTTADEMGLATQDARSELETAQAMLQRESEALCRAAVKRAREVLVAQGFEPAE